MSLDTVGYWDSHDSESELFLAAAAADRALAEASLNLAVARKVMMPPARLL